MLFICCKYYFYDYYLQSYSVYGYKGNDELSIYFTALVILT